MKDLAQHTFYKNLGARIREVRGAKLSQEQLAAAVDLTRTSIVNIESGRQKLLVHNLFRIAEVLGIRPTELLSTLEPSQGEVPQIEGHGEQADSVTRWVRRGIDKAIKNQSSP